MKKYPVIIRTAVRVESDKAISVKKVLESEEKYDSRKRSINNSILITELVNHWIELQKVFFDIRRCKVTREERGMIFNLLKSGIEIRDIKIAMGAMMYEYRFVEWFRQRELVPQIGTFVKRVNKYLSKVGKFEKMIQRNAQIDKVISFLGLNPVVEVENQRIPFGFKLEVELENFRLTDIVKIDGRNFWYVSDDGVRRKGVAYCHYVYEIDEVTKEKRFASDGIIIYVDNRNFDRYMNIWNKFLGLSRPSVEEIVDNVKLGLLRIGEIPLKYRKDVRDKLER